MVVLAQCWPSCMKYLIHGSALAETPRGLPTPYSGPHWDISSENMAPTAPSTRHSILEFQIAPSPSAGNVLQALWLLRITKEIEKFQEAVIIRTVNTVVLCCIVGDIKPACLPPLRTWNSTSTSSEEFNWILQRNSSLGPVQD